MRRHLALYRPEIEGGRARAYEGRGRRHGACHKRAREAAGLRAYLHNRTQPSANCVAITDEHESVRWFRKNQYLQ